MDALKKWCRKAIGCDCLCAMEKVERRWGTYTFYFFGSFFLSLCFLFGFWISNPLSNGFDNGVGDFGSRQPQGGEVPEGLLYYCCLSIMIHRYPEMSGVLIYGLRGESPILHNVLYFFFLFSKGFCIPSAKTFLDFLFLSVFWKNMQRNCFLFGFLIIIWIIIWKHLCNP